MNHTKNYGLPQWELNDLIRMEDFNRAMTSIESGLAPSGRSRRILQNPPAPAGKLTADSKISHTCPASPRPERGLFCP